MSKHHAPAFPVGQADRFCFVLISADAGPNAGDYANTLAGHQSEVRLIRPVAPPEIDSLVWLRAERRFRVVWRGFPRARATRRAGASGSRGGRGRGSSRPQ